MNDVLFFGLAIAAIILALGLASSAMIIALAISDFLRSTSESAEDLHPKDLP
jgi:hypothetical protein